MSGTASRGTPSRRHRDPSALHHSSLGHWVGRVRPLEEDARDARALASLDRKSLVVVAADGTCVKQSDGDKLPAGVDGAALDRTILVLSGDQACLSTSSDLVVVPGATHASFATSEHDALDELVGKLRIKRSSPR